MKYIVENTSEKIIIFKGDLKEFIEFSKRIAEENEDFALQHLIGTEKSAFNYLDTYCAVLTAYDEERFWRALEDVPVNEEGELEEDFLIFCEGADREEVWHWFEDFFNTQIGGKYI